MVELYEIVKQWGLYPEKIEEIKNNVWQVFTKEGQYALKASKLKPEKLNFIAEAQAHLNRCGFVHFARPIPLKGLPYYRYKNQPYTLYDWVEGDRCDFDNLQHLALASEALGKFHLYSRNKSFTETAGIRIGYFLWIDKISKRIDDLESFQSLAAKNHQEYFTKMYLGVYEPFVEKAKLAKRLLLTSSYPRIAKEDYNVGAFIHYDVAARNFVMQQENAYLIDFDYCGLDLPIVDLMRLIKRSLKYGKEAEAKINVIVDHYAAVHPLSKDHWQVLYALLMFPQKYWRLSERYFKHLTDWEAETFDKRMHNIVKELENENQWLPLFREKIGLR